MTTPTTRYGLSKIVLGSDNVDVVADFNNNWDAIDLKLGSQVCTSGARPASPIQGMLIFETDTGFVRTYNGTGWVDTGMPVCTSTTRPANPIQGDVAYETDTGGIIVYVGGGNWRYRSLIACTSTTRPTGAIGAGTTAYETDTKRFIIYNGSAWEQKSFANFVCTSSTHPATPFQGLEIYETDTGLNAVYTGSNYSYQATQIAPTQILGSTTASVTFSSIPAVNNLMIVWRGKLSTGTVVDHALQIDGSSTSANYQSSKVQGRSAAATVVANAFGTLAYTPIGVIASSTTASYFSSGVCTISGWGSSTGFISYSATASTFDVAGGYWTELYNGQYIGAVGPHTSIKLSPNGASYVAGSEFSLYALQ